MWGKGDVGGEEMSSSTIVCGVVVLGSGGGADTLGAEVRWPTRDKLEGARRRIATSKSSGESWDVEPGQASASQPPSFSWYHIKLQHGSFKEGKKERVRGLNRALSVDLKVCTGSSGRKSRPFKCDWAWLTWGSMVILSTVLFWGLVSVFTVRKRRSHFVSQSTEPNIVVVVCLALSVWFIHLKYGHCKFLPIYNDHI